MTGPAATILIVDDEIQNRKLLEALLRPEGYLTLSAATGEEALVSIAERAPDLILLDIMMPGMDGYQVASLIKADPATSSIPIIMVTAQTDRGARLAGLDAGAEDFLTKPVDRAELWLRVRNLLRLKTLGDFFQNHNAILEQQVQARTADLRESERRFSDMIGNVELVSVMLDREARITYCNDYLLRLTGWRREEVIGRDWFELFIPPGRDDVKDTFSALLADLPSASHYENEILTRSGGRRLIQWNNTALRSAAGEAIGIASIGDDITERKASETKIQRLTRLYAALSQCNEAIVRCIGEEELFSSICRAAVRFGGMKMAWIGIIHSESLMVGPVANFGDGAGYLQDIEISMDADSPFGRGPTGTAIRDDQPFWCQDFLNDPVTAPWHERGARTGWAASASLPLHRNGVVIGAFTLYSGESNAFDEAARRLLVEMATDIDFALDNFARESQRRRMEDEIRHYGEQLKTAFMSAVEVATTLSEMRDPYTAGHERRVAEIAVAIGAELGFDARRQEGLRVAGFLHDVGKITIPTEILTKPGKLSEVEFKLIQGHAQASYDVLKGVEFPWPVAQVALQHHERMDGSGYPQGLKGEAILLEARILGVADVVEAMSSHRPYRPARGIDKALAEIERGRGSAYDPVVADACMNLFLEKNYNIPA